MASLQEVRLRFEALKGREIEFASQALTECSEQAANFMVAQLAEGIESDGSKVSFSYAPMTIASKKNKSGLSSVTDHLTNYDTGESYRQLYEKVQGNKIIFGTTTDKEESINQRMDGKAFGLTNDHKEEFLKQNVFPLFAKKILQFLKL